MGNASGHEEPWVRNTIGDSGSQPLLLPPRNPGFNPIGVALPRPDARLIKAAGRTIEGLQNSVGEARVVLAPGTYANCCVDAGNRANRSESTPAHAQRAFTPADHAT